MTIWNGKLLRVWSHSWVLFQWVLIIIVLSVYGGSQIDYDKSFLLQVWVRRKVQCDTSGKHGSLWDRPLLCAVTQLCVWKAHWTVCQFVTNFSQESTTIALETITLKANNERVVERKHFRLFSVKFNSSLFPFFSLLYLLLYPIVCPTKTYYLT